MNNIDGHTKFLRYDRRYAERLKSALVEFDQRCLACFAACCAERLMPWVSYFQKEANLQPDETVRAGLDLVWNWIENGENPKGGFDFIYSNIEQFAPDTEDHSERSTSYCLNAVAAVAGAVALCRGASAGLAEESAHMVTDTIFLWIGVFGWADPETPAQLLRLAPQSGRMEVLGSNAVDRLVSLSVMAGHPRILRELLRQEADIQEIAAHRPLAANIITHLRERSADAIVIPFPDDPIWLAMEKLERQHKE